MQSERQTYKTMARHWEPLLVLSLSFIAFLRCEYGTVKSIKPIAGPITRLIQKIRGWIVCLSFPYDTLQNGADLCKVVNDYSDTISSYIVRCMIVTCSALTSSGKKREFFLTLQGQIRLGSINLYICLFDTDIVLAFAYLEVSWKSLEIHT